jgi:hypothetical protein
MAASVRVTQWNADRILGRAAQILEDYGPRISFQLQEEIAKDQFQWPVPTRRKSGQFVPAGLRDIVDTGQLLNSQTAPQVTDDGGLSVMTIRWTAPYSGEVLRGGYLVGTVRNNYVAPGRDWITPALKQQPFAPFFASRWRQLAGVG